MDAKLNHCPQSIQKATAVLTQRVTHGYSIDEH